MNADLHGFSILFLDLCQSVRSVALFLLCGTAVLGCAGLHRRRRGCHSKSSPQMTTRESTCILLHAFPEDSMRIVRYFLFVLLLSAFCAAQNGDIAIRAGNLIDPATGNVSKNQVIVIHDGKVASVGGAAPAGAKVIDLSNEWVMPGLMDAHTHITMNLPVNPPGESLWESYYVKESTGVRVLRGIHTGEILLNAGFTTVRDVGNNGNYGDVAVEQGIEKKWFHGPTVIPSGKIIGPFGGQFNHIAPEQGRFWDFEYIDADTPDELRKAVHQNIFYGAKVIKLVADNSAFHYSVDDIKA